MSNHFRAYAIFFCIIAITSLGVAPSHATDMAMPEFTHQHPQQWLNSPPLQRADLAYQVVLIHFWTFDCWNCYRSFPWLNNLEKEFSPLGLKIIGIHTPEFAHEKIRENVVKKISQFNIRHPVMIDNDFSYWNAMHNRYWPAYFLFGKDGTIHHRYYGETHIGDARAQEIEANIRHLLGAEPAAQKLP